MILSSEQSRTSIMRIGKYNNLIMCSLVLICPLRAQKQSNFFSYYLHVCFWGYFLLVLGVSDSDLGIVLLQSTPTNVVFSRLGCHYTLLILTL